jgi:hypothetical protein
VVAAKPALPAALAEAGADPGVWVEDKRLALVVHTRRTRTRTASSTGCGRRWSGSPARYGLEPHPGKMVMELRPPGFDKGGVLSRLAEEHAPAAVLFAGDDVGDLPGFAAVERLREAGTPGLTVASASAEAVEWRRPPTWPSTGRPAWSSCSAGSPTRSAAPARATPTTAGRGQGRRRPDAGKADRGPDAGDADDAVRSRRR